MYSRVYPFYNLTQGILLRPWICRGQFDSKKLWLVQGMLLLLLLGLGIDSDFAVETRSALNFSPPFDWELLINALHA